MKSEFESAAKRVLPSPAVTWLRPAYNGVVSAGRRVANIGSERSVSVTIGNREVPIYYPPAASGYFKIELDDSTVENCVPVELCDVPDSCDAIFDVGGYVGMYAALFRALNPDTPVYSYEPHDRNRRVCHRTVAANDGGVSVYGRAISGERGWIRLHESVEGDQGHSIVEHPDAGADRAVRAATIGDEIQRHGSRHPFVKLDIEGAERVVLRELLNLSVPVRGLVEFHPDKLADGMVDELVAELKSACDCCELLGDSSPDHPMGDRNGDRLNRPIYSFRKP